MKKFILLVLIFCAASAFGQDVSQSIAVDVANQYYQKVKNDNVNERISKIRTANRSRNDRVPELVSPSGRASMWLVPVEDGWVLVSTNTKTTPILAHYRTDQKPEYDQLAPGEKYLLEWYEQSIAYANDSCPLCKRNEKWDSFQKEQSQNNTQLRSDTAVFLPLVTLWGQTGNNSIFTPDCDKSYNKFCPVENAPNQCNKAAVGCVAVAIAQIMAYWKWPYGANVPIALGSSETEYKFFDWNKMPYAIQNFTNNTKVNAVTEFLRDCGYLVNMNYGVESFADVDDAIDALISCGYDGNTIERKKQWQTSSWQALLQAEIDAGRPVIYTGYPHAFGGKGHSFILKGYDSTGKFWINFGWHSNWDNFYKLDSIFADSTNFNHWQSAIVGIQPAPYCGSGTINSYVLLPSKFNISIGGELVLEDKVLQNVERGEFFSATQVRLTNGFTIKAGSNVHIAIKDILCQSVEDGTPSIQTIQAKKGKHIEKDIMNANVFSLSPNPVASILHIQMREEISQAKIYTINGQCVLQTSQTDIDVSSLPQGMYILRAMTADGQQHQAKFIKQ